MRRPAIERSALLGCPIVALIHPSNAAPAATDMVQNGFGHFEANTKALQTGGDGATQIVHIPWNGAAPGLSGGCDGLGTGLYDRAVERPLSL